MISLAITTFNRTTLTIESFINIIDNDFIDEIVIVDDCSDQIDIWDELVFLTAEYDKVKLYRNDVNLGIYGNKHMAVSLCKNEWVILFDSDNVINNDYIDCIRNIIVDKSVIYCPEILYEVDDGVVFNFTQFSKNNITCDVIVDNIYKDIFQALLNTCNYLVNKEEYLRVRKTGTGTDTAADTIHFAYLWFLSGNTMCVVPNLYYIHRLHSDSGWLKDSKKSTEHLGEMIIKMKALC